LAAVFLGCNATVIIAQALGFRFERNFTVQHVFEVLVFVCLAMPVLVTAVSAAAYSREHENETIDAIRMTLVRPRDVVLGKATAYAVVAGLILALCLSMVLPVVYMAYKAPGGIEYLIVSILVFTVISLLTLAVSTLVSVCVKRTSMAVVLAFLANAVVLVGPFAFMLVTWLAVYPRDQPPEDYVQIWMFFSPLLHYFWCMAGSPGIYNSGWQPQIDYPGILFNCAFHSAYAAVFFAIAVRVYATRRHRA
jgi:ABC-type transport system involved in multi-copper enzyme maturation permease subunit